MEIVEKVLVPQEHVNDEFVNLVKIYFKNGDPVKKGQIIAEIEYSKSIFTLEAVKDGFIYWLYKEGDDVDVGSPIAEIYETAQQKLISLKEQTQNDKSDSTHSGISPIVSKAAINLMKENNINVIQFQGYDFVTVHDVNKHLNELNPDINFLVEREYEQSIKHTKKSITYDLNNFEIIEINASKKREIEYLSSVQSSGLTSTLFTQINTLNLYPYLNTHYQFLSDTLLPVIIYESSRLLQKYKLLNAFYTDNKIYGHKKINIGFAVDIGEGLRVINIFNADKKSLLQIEEEVFNLINAFMDGKLSSDYFQDGTFTITDLSLVTVHNFVPLINKHQSAIMGISKQHDSTGDTTFSISFDHRVTEGLTIGRFLTELSENLLSYQDKSDIKSVNSDKPQFCDFCNQSLKEIYKQQELGLLQVVSQQNKIINICRSCFLGY